MTNTEILSSLESKAIGSGKKKYVPIVRKMIEFRKEFINPENNPAPEPPEEKKLKKDIVSTFGDLIVSTALLLNRDLTDDQIRTLLEEA